MRSREIDSRLRGNGEIPIYRGARWAFLLGKLSSQNGSQDLQINEINPFQQAFPHGKRA